MREVRRRKEEIRGRRDVRKQEGRQISKENGVKLGVKLGTESKVRNI